MTNLLQQHFPMLRSREKILKEINEKRSLKRTFCSWEEDQQKEFLDFCSGAKGVKMMYDFMAKEILNPEVYPERVNELLSLLLQQKVKILEVLPNDGTRLADEYTLLVMDLVVELQDGSIVDLEIQKIGYLFPGQRSACYSADLLLRQYRRVRKKYSLRKNVNKKKTYYKDIKSVYTIVLFENSPKEFKEFPDEYVHYFEQKSNSGVKIELLQKYVYVTLDNFNAMKHNKDGEIKLQNRLDAWLAFLSTDSPKDIIRIIHKYPDFKEMYEQVYEICQNIDEVMSMFSKELLELDRNTVQLMIDEMQEDIDQKKKDLSLAKQELEQAQGELEQTQGELEQTQGELEQTQGELEQTQGELGQVQEELQQTQKERDELLKRIHKLENR